VKTTEQKAVPQRISHLEELRAVSAVPDGYNFT